MHKKLLMTIVAALFVFAAAGYAQTTAQPAKAPYVTDAAQAQKMATEAGEDALLYFFSET